MPVESKISHLFVNGTVDPRQYIYIVRPGDEKLITSLASGVFCNVIAPREMGKSSAMRYAQLQLQDSGVDVADVDIAGNLGKHQVTADQWYCGFLVKVCRDLEIQIDIHNWWGSRRLTQSQRLQTFISEVIATRITRPCVIFVDEIDAALSLPFTDDFFTALRTMYNQRTNDPTFRNVTFCLIGTAHPSKFIRDTKYPAYNVGDLVEFSDFKTGRDDLSSLEKLFYGRKDSGKILVSSLLQWTGGHPYLTMLFCQKMLDPKLCQNVDDVTHIVEEYCQDVRAKPRGNHFVPLTEMAQNSWTRSTRSVYREILNGQTVHSADDHLEESTYSLTTSGLVKVSPNGTLAIRNKIFRRIFGKEWLNSLSPSVRVVDESKGSSETIRVGGTVDPQRHIYIERPHDEELYRLLRQGEYCNILSSRQTGKSSSMRYAWERLRAVGIIVVEIDLAGTLGAPASSDQWYCGLLQHLSRRLNVRVDVFSWWDQRSALPRSQRLQKFFCEELVPEVNGPIVVFIDEVDAALRLLYTNDFFAAVRSMFNQRIDVSEFQQVTFCLIGVASSADLIRDRRITPYNIGVDINLSDFVVERDDMSQLIVALRSKYSQAEIMLSEIMSWTGGHPFLTMKLCHECLSDDRCQSSIDVVRLVDALYQDGRLTRNDPHFSGITRFLQDRDGTRILALYERILQGKSLPSSSEEAQTALALSGLVKRSGNALEVRNWIYKKVFSSMWVNETRLRAKDKRKLERVRLTNKWAMLAMLAMALIIALLSYVNYASKRGGHASDDQRKNSIEETLIQQWIARLESTENESDAEKYFLLLSGNQVNSDIGEPVRGYENLAVQKYHAFWLRLAKKYSTKAEEIAVLGKLDEAMILGVYASIKGGLPISQPVRALYEQSGYAHLKVTLRGHSKAVNEALFLGNSETVVTASDDGSLRMWRVDDGQLLDTQVAEVEGETTRLLSLSLSKSRGREMLVTTSPQSHFDIWEVTTGRAESTLNHVLQTDTRQYHDFLLFASLSPLDSKSLITAGGQVTLWALSKDKIKSLSHAGKKLSSASYSTDGRFVVLSDIDGRVEIWNAKLKKKLKGLKLDNVVVRSQFDSSGRHVAIASHNGKARLWSVEGSGDVRTFTHDASLLSRDFEIVRTAAICNDFLATSATVRKEQKSHQVNGYSGIVVVWRLEDGTVYRKFFSKYRVYSASWSPDCTMLVSSDEYGYARIWSLTPTPLSDTSQPISQEQWLLWQSKLQLSVSKTGVIGKLEHATPTKGWLDVLNTLESGKEP